jgi:hypothetical protein
MERQMKGLAAIKTLRTRKQGTIPGSDRGADQLQLYILENNRALLEKELGSVLQHKAKIMERIKMIEENMSAIKGRCSTGRARKKTSLKTAGCDALGQPKSIQRMKVDY